ncbi:HEAT repeat domain-containing protein [Polycladidibacter hongkongensis]|uniref:HEAT repeat domain-containing protein n=1 Tax=Polycladidibacter hongkongensis TaxID=1647556 RepID=UPI0008336F54|nr:hypothetical protein [Pseudovibrio hongkongensis]
MCATIQKPEAVNRVISETLLKIAQEGSPAEQCLALKALTNGKHSATDADTRRVLLDLTRNDDPDVRVDALCALVSRQEPDIGEHFLWSLLNDPVGDSKLAALKGLGQKDKDTAAPLLQKLLLDRCEETVAWEDEAGQWDDWLDVQKGVIAAIARLKITDCLPALLQVTRDEMGQDLWEDVLTALSQFGEAGVMELIAIGQLPNSRLRRRAAAALGRTAEPLAERALNALTQDQAAEVRLASCEALLARGADLPLARLLTDTSSELRIFALRNAQDISPAKLIDFAVRGASAEERIAALERLAETRIDHAAEEQLLQDIVPLLRRSEDPYICALIAVLARVASPAAQALLLDIQAQRTAPSVQCAVVQAFRQFPDCENVLSILAGAIAGNSQSLRLHAMATLAALAAEHGEGAASAQALLAEAAKGTLTDAENVDAAQEEVSQERAGRTDEESKSRIRIDRDGNVLEPASQIQSATDSSEHSEPKIACEHEEDSFPQSTLAAVLQGDAAQATAPEEKVELSQSDLKLLELAQSTLKKKRVRPDIAADKIRDCQLIALRLVGEQDDTTYTQLLCEQALAADAQIRFSALQSLLSRARRGVLPDPTLWQALPALVKDNHLPLRSIVVQLLAYAPKDVAEPLFTIALRTGATQERAEAIKYAPANELTQPVMQQALASRDRVVRAAAITRACAEGTGEATALLGAALLESGALGSILAKELNQLPQGVWSEAVKQQLCLRCQTQTAERTIALQILAQLEAGTAIAA